MKYILLLFFFCSISYAQVGIGTTTPDASSVLEVTSTSSGILIPRMTEVQRTGITTPATGLLVYQTDNTVGFWYYNGSTWVTLDNTPSWDLAGNSGTNASTNFIGTQDDVDLIFKRNNVQSGFIGTEGTSFGVSALNTLNTGNDNAAFGDGSLAANTSGFGNTALGSEALVNNSSGGRNTAIGRRAMRWNTTTFDNTAIGYESMRGLAASTGSSNTAVGQQSLYNISSGSANVAIGVRSLDNNNTGSSNTAIGGLDCLGTNSSGNFNVAIGTNAMRDNSTGGTNTAVGSSSLLTCSTGVDNTALGYAALGAATLGNQNTSVGAQSGNNITTGSNNIIVGYNANVPSGTTDNQVRIGNTSVTYAGVQVAWTITSDRHWKNSVRKLPYGLEMLMDLNPVDYLRNNSEEKGREMGFIAQEVMAVLENYDYGDQGFLTKDDEGHYGIRYNDFISLLVNAVQEQQQIINEQKTTIEQFNTRLEKLEAQSAME